MSDHDVYQYVDSVGRVPRGVAGIANADRIRQILLLKLVVQLGGQVTLENMGDEYALSQLLVNWELKIGGTGDGGIIIEAVPK